MVHASLFFLALLSGARAQDPPKDPRSYIDEVKEEVLAELDRCLKEKAWTEFFKQAAIVRTRYPRKVVPVEATPENRRWIGLKEHLIRRLSKLPKAAVEAYRVEFGAAAEEAFRKAREQKDDGALFEASEKHFLAEGAGRALDELAGRSMKEGRPGEAIRLWSRLLYSCPDSAVPKALTAARLGKACVTAKDVKALERLKGYAARAQIDDPEGSLRKTLETLDLPPDVPPPAPGRMPLARGLGNRRTRRFDGIRNEIRLWSYSFSEGKAPPAKPGRILLRGGRSAPRYPLFPAHARLKGRDYVVGTDGTRVLAVDPSRVEGVSTTKGVYWKYPADARIFPALPPRASMRPYIGAAVSGGRAYATVYAPDRPAPAANARNADPFVGVTTVKCFDVSTGKLLWDTNDDALKKEMERVCRGFFDRNFSFTGRPVVRDGRVFLGVTTSPWGEVESWVVCLDAETGKPLWSAFLCSYVAARNRWGWTAADEIVPQTLLIERDGILFAHTGLGFIASLDGRTGDLLWLSKYPRSAKDDRWNRRASIRTRPANWPHGWKGTLFVLPQDQEDLVAFETATGRPIDLPEVKWRFGNFSWGNMTHLVGITSDWMVIGGNQSHVLRLRDFQAYSLAASVTTRYGMGVIHEGLAYLSQQFPDKNKHPYGVLGIYDARSSPGSRGQPTWKNRSLTGWKTPGEGGNLLVAGDCLVVATGGIAIYTDMDSLRRRFASRLDQNPPDLTAHVEFGAIMTENGRFGDAIESYRAFEKAAAGVESLKPEVNRVRFLVYQLYLTRASEAAGRKQVKEELEFTRSALEYAPDELEIRKTEERIAELEEALKNRK